MQTGSYETGNVSDIDHEVSADLLGNLAETREVDDAGICGSSGDDELRLAFHSSLFESIVVDDFAAFGNTVGNNVEILTAHVDR